MRSNIGDVVRPNPNPMAPMTKAAPIKTKEVMTIWSKSGMESFGENLERVIAYPTAAEPELEQSGFAS